MQHRTTLNKEKGASLLLVILILTAVLTIAFGAANLMLEETKISRTIPYSLRAYYAAEVGIERSLYDTRRGSGASDIGSPPNCSGGGAVCLEGLDTCYSVDVIAGAETTTIKSYGCYKGVKRAVETTY